MSCHIAVESILKANDQSRRMKSTRIRKSKKEDAHTLFWGSINAGKHEAGVILIRRKKRNGGRCPSGDRDPTLFRKLHQGMTPKRETLGKRVGDGYGGAASSQTQVAAQPPQIPLTKTFPSFPASRTRLSMSTRLSRSLSI